MTKLNRLKLTTVIIIIFNVLLTLYQPVFGNTVINENFHHYNIPRTEFLELGLDSTKIIVIDPGHGGKDNGASYRNIREKNITLSIAKELRVELERAFPQLMVILTRENDKFIPLYERIEKANNVNANLFISIHCNSYDRDNTVNGSEVFTLGLTDSEDNLNIAMRENASVLFERDYQSQYEWHDPNSIEAYIFLSAYQNLYIDKSINLANRISKSLHIFSKFKNRGIKQSGFVILKNATMPSILIETGFLSNPNDRKKLISLSGQKQIAKGISEAVIQYFNSTILSQSF